MRTKEEYENIINKSEILERARTKDDIKYKTELYKIQTNLYEYCIKYIYTNLKYFQVSSYNNEKTFKYNLEFMKVNKDCLKSFCKNNGDYLNYFNKSFSRKIHSSVANDNYQEQHKGINIGKAKGCFKYIVNKAKSENRDIYDKDFQLKIAEYLNISLKEVQENISIYFNSTVISDTIITNDGEEISIFDTIITNKNNNMEILEEDDKLNETLDRINTIFNNCQERQKPIIKKLFVANIFKDGQNDLIEKIKDYNFYDKEMHDYYKKHNKVPLAKEIAKYFDISEQSLSRTYNNFLKKINGEKDESI